MQKWSSPTYHAGVVSQVSWELPICNVRKSKYHWSCRPSSKITMRYIAPPYIAPPRHSKYIHVSRYGDRCSGHQLSFLPYRQTGSTTIQYMKYSVTITNFPLDQPSPISPPFIQSHTLQPHTPNLIHCNLIHRNPLPLPVHIQILSQLKVLSMRYFIDRAYLGVSSRPHCAISRQFARRFLSWWRRRRQETGQFGWEIWPWYWYFGDGLLR